MLKDTPYRCGCVSIVGRPNVGKSTLLNALVGEKVAAVSKIPQTTRSLIRGIYTDERGQIIFLDTPGLHKGKDRLDHIMNKSSIDTLLEADCVVYLVDTQRRVGEEEHEVMRYFKSLEGPIILALNKVDLKPKYMDQYIELWKQERPDVFGREERFVMLPISSIKGTNLDKLLDLIFERLPFGPLLYPEDTLTDMPRRRVIADIIQEKLFQVLRKEVPHDVGVIITEIIPKRRKVLYIAAQILVARESQKEIVIGRGGRILKDVGTEAREELEDLLEQKIFLDLRVKVNKDWRNNLSLLKELGYTG